MSQKNLRFPSKKVLIGIVVIFGILATLFTNCRSADVSFQESMSSIQSRLNASFIRVEYGQEFTNKPKVRLDLGSPSAVETYVTNNPNCQSGGLWEPYKETRMWELESKNSPNSVYVVFRDSYGYISKCISDSIVHDDIPPTVSFNNLNDLKTTKNATIKFDIIDNLSGVKREETICTLDSQEVPCKNSQFSFKNNSGGHSVEVVATDQANNPSQIHSFTWTSDFDLPTVRLTSTPPQISGARGLSFSFIGADVHSSIKSYKCFVDSFSEKDCTSPFSITSLGGGTHTFTVVSIDGFDNRSVPAQYTWVVDTTAPSISITGGPRPLTNVTRAQFQFTGSDSQGILTGFECRLDSGSYTVCSSGQTYDNLSLGGHTFNLRARDNFGNTSTPISYSWEIDTSAPIIQISQSPDLITKESTAHFVWTVSENSGQIASQECLHNGHSISCSGLSHRLSGLAEGSHTFQIRVTDVAGNSGDSIKYKWVIDTTPPRVTISRGPDSLTGQSNATFIFLGMDSGSSISHYQCQMDRLKLKNCTSPHSYSGLSHGSHVFYVTAVDKAQNVSVEESYLWFIDLEPPLIQWTQVPKDHTENLSTVVSFTVSDTHGGIDSVHCGLDGTREVCQSNQSKILSDLSVGPHRFKVEATDIFGNTSILEHQWEVTKQHMSTLGLGYGHTCRIVDGGQVECWGDGKYGQLGHGTSSDSQTPVKVHASSTDSTPLSGVIGISSGYYHTCALINDGKVKCWGEGEWGQLGNNGTGNQTTPVNVHTSSTDSTPLSHIQGVSASGVHTCALTNDGKVKCWGQGKYDQLVNDEEKNLVPIDIPTSSTDSNPLSGITMVSAGRYHNCALTTAGTVKCWGAWLPSWNFFADNPAPRYVPTSSTDSTPLSGVVSISSGNAHTCVLTHTGKVKCWGDSRYVGTNEDTGNQFTPVDVHTSATDSTSLSGIVAVSCGEFHTCVLTNTGTVKCWGSGYEGALGSGVKDNQRAPVDVHTSSTDSNPLSGIIEVVSGYIHTCVLTNVGKAKCWGGSN